MIRKAKTNLKYLLIDNGWTSYGMYSLKSPDYKNAQIFIADVYNEYCIRIYIGRSTIAQDGTYVCEFTSKRKLMTFLNLMKNL